ncbi:MAG: hypothetical protein JOZ15_14110 [Acidobacteria bacterium]|nr:hypothetical protein [Acidobacteriota bacterium]
MELCFPWDTDPCGETRLPPTDSPGSKRPGRRPAARQIPAAAAPDWLYHHLTIHGPAGRVAAFAEAARGAGIIPWRRDFALLEEDIFNLAAAQPPERRSLSIDGCRILARQFRDQAEAWHARALARVGRSRACPFDLYALLPVPPAILLLGPTHPEALAWLAMNWGTTDGLRHAAVRPGASTGRRLPAGHTVIGYGFFTFGETPHAAIASLAERWPELRFRLQPRPPD